MQRAHPSWSRPPRSLAIAWLLTKLDRLARSTRDLLNTLAAIAAAGASFKSLGDQWADTTTPHGRLMLTVLGGLAEFERHLILARTSEGRQRAQSTGVRFGRKPKLTAHQQQEALARRVNGEALVDIARTCNVSHSTISRLAGQRAGAGGGAGPDHSIPPIQWRRINGYCNCKRVGVMVNRRR
jgi:DNA invertase Pin-like site-specific DNA recombinase